MEFHPWEKNPTNSLSQAIILYFILFLTSSYSPWDRGIEIFLWYHINIKSFCFFSLVIVKCSHVSTFHCKLVKRNINMT